jgi:hypothetical protein
MKVEDSLSSHMVLAGVDYAVLVSEYCLTVIRRAIDIDQM